MQDDEDGAGSVAVLSPRLRGGGAASAGWSRPSVPPDPDLAPSFFWPEMCVSTVRFGAGACDVPFGRVSAGLNGTLYGGACLATLWEAA